MLHVSVHANTRGAPGVNIESFPSRQVTLAYFFRSAWDELEALTSTRGAVVLNTATFQECLLVGLEKMSTEAS